ncbi:MAG: hypothetical protein PUD57_06545 [Clostridiales bacterium]|nr:hypothetical protein [Clostridiales bacterium]
MTSALRRDKIVVSEKVIGGSCVKSN